MGSIAHAESHTVSTDAAAEKPDSEAAAVTEIETTTIAIRGKPAYPPEFTQFKYVNVDAPKGGVFTDWVMGTFDNFNPYSQRGDAASGSGTPGARGSQVGPIGIHESLMQSSSDDLLSAYYPFIAEKITYNSDFSAITFHLDKRARFQDGERIKPSDVKFSFEKLTSEGLPGLKQYYSFVEKIEVLDDTRVKFSLNTKDKARMMALCGFTVFAEHFWKDHRLDEPLKEPPVGSGAYKVADYKFGKYVKYERVKDYWADELPVMRGIFNDAEVQYDYYLDGTVAFEAFKAGHIDIWEENTSKRWATGYDFPAVKDGRVKQLNVEHKNPLRAQGFVFNVKQPIFSDLRVRKALTYLMDFEWMNKNLFYGQYIRVDSYFMNTAYKATGLPSEAELKILEPIKDKIPASVFTEELKLPTTKGDGNIRSNLRQALRLFKEAGWTVKNQKLVDKNGKQFEFELLLGSTSMERVALPFRNNLERAGIKMNIRTVDSSQYMNRSTGHDYDMVVSGYGPFAYPSSGTNQQFHSDSVDSSYNPANLTDDAVDYLMEEMLKVQDDDEKLIPLGRAIDRVLMHSYLMIPQWNSSSYRIAHWDKFGKPELRPDYGLGHEAWWIDTDKAAKLNAN
jgi:microcin C transport system substrate-binding protein